MQKGFIVGNQFQSFMQVKFDVDLNSKLAIMSYIKGKEDLVYGYIRDIASIFQPVRYGSDNPTGLYSDYDSYKIHFIKYWKNAIGISRAKSDKLGNIFDEEVSKQENCKNRTVPSVFFENGKALTADDCLNAIYEVLRMV